MLQYSEMFDRWYQTEDMNFYRNTLQAARYLEWGAKLQDLFVDSKHRMVFVYSKEDHARFRDRWGTKENNQVED